MAAQGHLSHKLLAQAAVGGSELDCAQAAHLASCPECAQALKQLQADLGRLTLLAREHCPQAPPLSLTRRPKATRTWGRPKLALAGMAAVAALVTAICLGPQASILKPHHSAFNTVENGEEVLFVDLDPEPDGGLSPFLQFMLGGGQMDLDDDLMDFLAPASGEEMS